MLNAQDIVIDRLRINADTGAAQKLSRELAYESWPLHLPAKMRDAWVFVRELHVRGKAQDMRRETAHALESSLYHAVDGKLAAAQHAQAVRFDSLPELLAFLLRDIVQGAAIQKWYWARWSYLIKKPRDEAVAQLLFEHIEHIAAVVHQLYALGELKRVWLTLTKPAARHIVRQLEKKTQISLHDSPIKINSYVHSDTFVHARRHWVQHSSFGSPWVNVFEHLDVTDERVKLAAVISALEYCPLLLMHDANATLAAFVSVVLEKTDRVEITHGNFHGLDPVNNFSSVYPKKNNNDDISNEKKYEKNVEGSDVDNRSNLPTQLVPGVAHNVRSSLEVNQVDTSALEKVKFANSPLITTTPQSPVKKPEKNTETQLSITPDEIAKIENTDNPVAVGESFYTVAGGFFYFINAINRFVSRERMQDHIGEGSGNGWLWLYQFAMMVEAKRRLNTIDQPLKRFIVIAANLGYEDIDQYAANELVNFAYQKMEAQFFEKTFWVEDQSLLRIPAHVVTTPSHVDVYFPLSAVRLDVRLAGLDINPGWVSWLGRVVNFHYIDSINSTGFNHE